MIRVMGLDLKPARSGIAQNYVSTTGAEHLTVAAVSSPLLDLHERVRETERAVLARLATRPDVAFIEGTFSRRSTSDYGQHAVHFAVTHILWHYGIPWVDVPPSQLKIWATGSGSQRGATKVTKDKVIAAIIATYGRLMHIPAGDDDACDAVALMTMGLAAYGAPLVDVPASQRRAIKDLKLPPLGR